MGISREQALECFASDDLIGIGMEADAVRRRLHPEGVVSYVVDREVDCAMPTLDALLRETVEMGGTGVVLHGTLRTERTVSWYEELLSGLRVRFPGLWLHGLSATEMVAAAAASGMSVADAVSRMQAAGLCSLAGDDAGILDDAVQTAVPRCTVAEWVAVHRAAHGLGMRTTAAMIFGAGETMEHRVSHLETLQRLQEDTGGFTAFAAAAFQPAAAGVRGFEEATAVEYLTTLAVSRMYLDNIENVQADWARQGLKVLQMALRFGGNDVGSVMPGAMIAAAEGTTEEDLRRVIRGAGFRPVQRDTAYRTVFLN